MTNAEDLASRLASAVDIETRLTSLEATCAKLNDFVADLLQLVGALSDRVEEPEEKGPEDAHRAFAARRRRRGGGI